MRQVKPDDSPAKIQGVRIGHDGWFFFNLKHASLHFSIELVRMRKKLISESVKQPEAENHCNVLGKISLINKHGRSRDHITPH